VISIISIPGYYGGANFYVVGDNITYISSSRGNSPKYCPRDSSLVLVDEDYRFIRKLDIFSGVYQDLAKEVRGFSPSWSPDCTHIAFLAVKKDAIEVYVMDADGGNIQQLTDNKLKKINTAYSPDGRSMVYEFRDGDFVGVGVVTIATKEEKRGLLRKGFLGLLDLKWSPDGTKIAVGYYFSLYNAITVVSVSDLAPIWSLDRVSSIAWSPDGQRIALVSVSGSNAGEIYVMPASGGTPQQVTSNNLMESQLSWQPDGRLMYLTSEYEYEYEGHGNKSWNFQVNLINPDGSGLMVPPKIEDTFSSSPLRKYLEEAAKMVAKSLADGAKKYTSSAGGTP